MKRILRFVLIATASLAILLLLVAGLAFLPAFQTWAARRVLADQPGTTVSLGRLAAGLQQVKVETVHARQSGAVLTLPSAVADLAVLDAVRHDRVTVRHFTAKGWTLDLTQYVAPGRESAAPGPTAPEAAATAVALVFNGIFSQLKLPVDLAVDGVELDGDLVLPGPPGQAATRAHVTLTGGGLAAGREGRFVFSSRITLAGADTPVNALEVHGNMEAAMDTPRTFTRLAARFDALAAGPALKQEVQLTAEIVAARVSGGENYTLNVQSLGKRLVDLQANYPIDSARFGGVWKLDLRDTDLAPFALGRSLPAFEAVGAGMFETDTGFAVVHAAGRLQSSASRLAIFQPELDAIGVIGLFSEFDLTLHGGAVRVDRLTLNVTRPDPVLTVQSQQPFEFNHRTGELKVANPAADLLVINLQGVPVRWLAPFVQPYDLTGGMVRGEFAAGAAGGGLVLRARTPLRINGLALAESGRPLLANIDLEVDAAAEYSPHGWQLDLTSLKAGSGAAPWLTASGRAGRLAGKDQIIKATGRWTAFLPGLMQQPVALGSASLERGQCQGEFTASLGPSQELQARLRFEDLMATDRKVVLPTITAELRADTAPDGQTVFNLPLVFENQARSRRTDLALTGSLQVLPEGFNTEARVTSREIFLEDVQVLAALAGAPVPAPGTSAPGPVESRPFWSGLSGQLSLALKKLHYNDLFEVSDVQGTLRLERGALQFSGLRAGLGEEGAAAVSGGLRFEPKSDRPYTFAGDLDVKSFNPKPLLLALNPDQAATVDGNFDVVSQLTGRAANLEELAEATKGDFQLTSKGGLFHGLPVSVASRAESTSRIAAGVAAVGNLLGSVTGKKEYADIANKAQAVSELSKALASIPYDQLSVTVARDDSLTTVLKDFALISPELRLTGGGQATVPPGASLLDGPLTMEFKLRARGHAAHLFKYLGVLEAEPDELGYFACNLPLRVGGSIRAPDTSEINRTLTNLALEKSGAGDLLNKLLGGGK